MFTGRWVKTCDIPTHWAVAHQRAKPPTKKIHTPNKNSNYYAKWKESWSKIKYTIWFSSDNLVPVEGQELKMDRETSRGQYVHDCKNLYVPSMIS